MSFLFSVELSALEVLCEDVRKRAYDIELTRSARTTLVLARTRLVYELVVSRDQGFNLAIRLSA